MGPFKEHFKTCWLVSRRTLIHAEEIVLLSAFKPRRGSFKHLVTPHFIHWFKTRVAAFYAQNSNKGIF